MKNFKQLLQQYNVVADFICVSSNLVYPMDSRDYVFHGYVEKDELDQLFVRIMADMNEKSLCSRIQNKYAIPFLQVGHMNILQTFFYYQHDDRTYLISKTESSDKYLG